LQILLYYFWERKRHGSEEEVEIIARKQEHKAPPHTHTQKVEGGQQARGAAYADAKQSLSWPSDVIG